MLDFKLKLLVESTREVLEDIDLGKDFLNWTVAMIQKIRARINKWNGIKLKSFCIAKKQSTESRESLQNGTISLPDIHLKGN
jgi:hypothetical protein